MYRQHRRIVDRGHDGAVDLLCRVDPVTQRNRNVDNAVPVGGRLWQYNGFDLCALQRDGRCGEHTGVRAFQRDDQVLGCRLYVPNREGEGAVCSGRFVLVHHPVISGIIRIGYGGRIIHRAHRHRYLCAAGRVFCLLVRNCVIKHGCAVPVVIRGKHHFAAADIHRTVLHGAAAVGQRRKATCHQHKVVIFHIGVIGQHINFCLAVLINRAAVRLCIWRIVDRGDLQRHRHIGNMAVVAVRHRVGKAVGAVIVCRRAVQQLAAAVSHRAVCRGTDFNNLQRAARRVVFNIVVVGQHVQQNGGILQCGTAVRLGIRQVIHRCNTNLYHCGNGLCVIRKALGVLYSHRHRVGAKRVVGRIRLKVPVTAATHQLQTGEQCFIGVGHGHLQRFAVHIADCKWQRKGRGILLRGIGGGQPCNDRQVIHALHRNLNGRLCRRAVWVGQLVSNAVRPIVV